MTSVHHFICTSGYHLFAASQIAAELQQSSSQGSVEAVITFVTSKATPEPKGVSGLTRCVPGLRLERFSIGRGVQLITDLRRLQRKLVEDSPNIIWVASDRSILGRSIMQPAQTRGIPVAFFEDGTDAYASSRYASGGLQKGLRRSMIQVSLGIDCSTSAKIASTVPTAQFWASYPDSVAEEIAEAHEIRALVTTPSTVHERNRELVAAWLLEGAGSDPASEELGSLDVMVVPDSSHHSGRSERSTVELRNLLDCLVKAGLKVGIGYHPSEPDSDPLDGATHGCLVLPRKLPSDSVIASAGFSGLAVVGQTSSVLLLASWLLPGLALGRLAVDQTREPPGIGDLYARIAIPSWSTGRALCEWLTGADKS